MAAVRDEWSAGGERREEEEEGGERREWREEGEEGGLRGGRTG